jgi:hypothetical protein
VSINGRALDAPVKVDGQYALVPLRLYENRVLIGDVATMGQLAAVAAAPEPAPAPVLQSKPVAAAPVRSTTRPAARTAIKPTMAAPAPVAKN